MAGGPISVNLDVPEPEPPCGCGRCSAVVVSRGGVAPGPRRTAPPHTDTDTDAVEKATRDANRAKALKGAERKKGPSHEPEGRDPAGDDEARFGKPVVEGFGIKKASAEELAKRRHLVVRRRGALAAGNPSSAVASDAEAPKAEPAED